MLGELFRFLGAFSLILVAANLMRLLVDIFSISGATVQLPLKGLSGEIKGGQRFCDRYPFKLQSPGYKIQKYFSDSYVDMI